MTNIVKDEYRCIRFGARDCHLDGRAIHLVLSLRGGTQIFINNVTPAAGAVWQHARLRWPACARIAYKL
jgi:hypothetical protein